MCAQIKAGFTPSGKCQEKQNWQKRDEKLDLKMVAAPDVARKMTELAIITVANVQQSTMSTQETQEHFIARLVYVLSVVKTKCLEVSGFALTVGLNNRKDENGNRRAKNKGLKIMKFVVKVQGSDMVKEQKRVSVQGVGREKLSRARKNVDNALIMTLLFTASGILTSPIQGNTGLKIDSATTVDSH